MGAMERKTKARILRCLACFLLVAGSVSAQSLTDEDLTHLGEIFLDCRHPEGPTAMDDLHAYAQGCGFSDAEMASRLMQLVRKGLPQSDDPLRRHVTEAALCALVPFAGESGVPFVREVMQDAENGNLRQMALRAGLRMTPEKWEEWVREAVADKRFGDFDRWMVYEDVFRIGRDGDEKTRQRVIEVLSEMRASDSRRMNQNSLGGWVAELKGGDAWETWLKEVVTGEGFYGADREKAFNLAMQTGRNGDAKTRQRVIEVFGELCADESLDVDREALRRWIGELEELP